MTLTNWTVRSWTWKRLMCWLNSSTKVAFCACFLRKASYSANEAPASANIKSSQSDILQLSIVLFPYNHFCTWRYLSWVRWRVRPSSVINLYILEHNFWIVRKEIETSEFIFISNFNVNDLSWNIDHGLYDKMTLNITDGHIFSHFELWRMIGFYIRLWTRLR